MVTVETIGRIRRAFLVDHKPIRQIVRELRVSRKTVRKAIRGSSTEFRYDRQAQPQPRLGEFVARLDGLLEANSKRPARERLTARRGGFPGGGAREPPGGGRAGGGGGVGGERPANPGIVPPTFPFCSRWVSGVFSPRHSGMMSLG